MTSIVTGKRTAFEARFGLPPAKLGVGALYVNIFRRLLESSTQLFSKSYIQDYRSGSWTEERVRAEALATFKKLEEMKLFLDINYLNLSGLNLKEIPAFVFECTNLTYLNISNNPGIKIDRIGNFKNLEIIRASGCFLKRVPLMLLRLKNLKEMIFDHNELVRLPYLHCFAQLVKADFSNNNISWISPRIGIGPNQTTMKILKLANNKLNCPLPPSFYNFKRLVVLHLQGNAPSLVGPLLRNYVRKMRRRYSLRIRLSVLLPEGTQERRPISPTPIISSTSADSLSSTSSSSSSSQFEEAYAGLPLPESEGFD